MALAEDTNTRVLTALELYTSRGRARPAAVTEGASNNEPLDFVMQERVTAGISDRADLSRGTRN